MRSTAKRRPRRQEAGRLRFNSPLQLELAVQSALRFCAWIHRQVSNRSPSRRVSFPCPTHVRRWQMVLNFQLGRILKLGRIGAGFCCARQASFKRRSRVAASHLQAGQSMPCDRAVFENVPSIIPQPNSAWCVLFGGVWRTFLEILRGEVKVYVMGLRHACRSTESLGKRLLFLLDNMALVLGASKGRGCMPNLNHTCREISVISLATFIIPIRRWIASEDNPADEPSRSKRYSPSMHSDADQCRPSATRSAPDAELLAVLSAEAARVASEETQTRKQSASRSCAGVTNQNRGRMEAGSQTTRRKRAGASSSTPFSGESGWSASPLRRVVRPRAELSHRSYGPMVHGHAQRFPGLLENVAGRAEVRVGRDGGGDAGTPLLSRVWSRSWRLPDGSNQVRRMDSKFLRSPPRRTSAEGTGYVSEPSSVGCGSSNVGGGNGCERRRVCGDARCPICGLLEAQRIVQSDIRPGHSSPQRVRRRQLGTPPGSPGRVEDLENRRVRRKRLAGRSSFDRNGKVLTRYTAGKAATTPL